MASVLHIVSYKFLPPVMGGGRNIALFFRYFSKLLPVTLVTTKNNGEATGEQYELKRILSDSPLRYLNPFYYFTIRSIIRKKNITHLSIEHPYYGWLAILLKKTCNVKLIIRSHNIESLRFKSTGKWWWNILWHYEKYTHKHADLNFFITPEDSAYAISDFGVDPAKCHIITYGFEQSGIPCESEANSAKHFIREAHNISPDEKMLLFNGMLSYKPNLDAVDSIIKDINPLLIKEKQFKYKIIICGGGLPEQYDNLKRFLPENIIYAGFVPDIDVYFKGADIFINPVIHGGGIKTKLVEAIGYNLSAVSTRTGANGLPENITGDKLQIAADYDWQDFTNKIIQANTMLNTPESFYRHFYWGHIASKATEIIFKETGT